MASYSLPADQNGRVPFAFKTKTGADAKIDGVAKVTSSDETVAKFTIDGANIFVDTVGAGKATGTIEGDADLGAGVVPVSATFDVEVVGLNADRVDLGDIVLEPKP